MLEAHFQRGRYLAKFSDFGLLEQSQILHLLPQLDTQHHAKQDTKEL